MKCFFERQYYYMSKYNKIMFKNWKGWESQAVISITMVQFLILLNIILAVSEIIFPETKRKFNTYEIIIFLVMFFGLDYYNNKIYKGQYEEFDARWGNEPKKKKVISIIIITLTIMIAWGLVFINGWIFGRFITY
jgi:hypothetical protein